MTISITGNATLFDRFSRLVKANSCDADALCETKGVSATSLTGEGNAYACLDNKGKFYRSTTGCFNCGNGMKENTEECDGADLGGQTCETLLGLILVQPLSCNADCTFDVKPCYCGNDIIDEGEVCDSTILGVGVNTCITQGFTGGPLGCLADCSDFDNSRCTICGNANCETPYEDSANCPQDCV